MFRRILYLCVLLYSTTWAAIYTPADATALRNALTAAVCGDVIEIPAAGISGSFTVPGKGDCSANPVIITAPSTNTAKLPAPNQRVTPAYAGLLGKLITTDGSPVLIIGYGANPVNGLIVRNLEFAQTAGNTVLIQVGGGSRADDFKTVSHLPKNITFDRCLIRTGRLRSSRRTMLLNSASTTVVNSWIEQTGRAGTDSQAIASYGGSGPFYLHNNYIEGETEVIGFGGSAIIYDSPSPLIPTFSQRYATSTVHPVAYVWHNHISHGGNYMMPEVWTAARAVPPGKIIKPTVWASHFYIAQNAGTTGAAEPAWCTSGSCTVADGAVTWKETTQQYSVKNMVENKLGTLDVRYNYFDRSFDTAGQGFVMTAGARLSDTSAAARVTNNVLAHNVMKDVGAITNMVHSRDPSDQNCFPTVVGTVPAPYAITAGVNDKIRLSVNGGAAFDVTLTAGPTRTAADIVYDINEALLAQSSINITAVSDGGWNSYYHKACFTAASHGYPALGQMQWSSPIYIKGLAGGNWAGFAVADVGSIVDANNFCALVPANLSPIGAQTGTGLKATKLGAAKVFTDTSARMFVQVSGPTGDISTSKIEFQAVASSAYTTLGLPQTVIRAGTHPITQQYYHWAINSNLRAFDNLAINVQQAPYTNGGYPYIFGFGAGWPGVDFSHNSVINASNAKGFMALSDRDWMPTSGLTTQSNIMGYTGAMNPRYFTWTDTYISDLNFINYYGATYTFDPLNPVNCSTDARVAPKSAAARNWIPNYTQFASSDPQSTGSGCSQQGIYKGPYGTIADSWNPAYFRDQSTWEVSSAVLKNKGHDAKDVGADINQLPLIRNLKVTPSDKYALFQFDLSAQAAKYPVSLRICTEDPEVNPVCSNIADLDPAVYARPDSSDNDRFPAQNNRRTMIVGQNARLTPGSTYYYQLEGGGVSAKGTFTTTAATAGTVKVPFVYTPHAAGTASVAIDYGLTYSRASDAIGSGGTVTGACSQNARCTLTVTATPGVPLYVRARYLDSGGATLWSGPSLTALP